MAGIPLPALDVRPPAAPPNQLEQLGQILGLKNAIQNAPLQNQALQQQVQAGSMENQQRQVQLQDQQAVTKAMQQWDGKDLNALPTLVLKNGGSGMAVMGLVDPKRIVRNSTARPGGELFLTKPLGLGIVSTAIT